MATICTYQSHCQRALQFFFGVQNVMFGVGRTTAWGELDSEKNTSSLIDEKNPPYPDLDATEVTECFGYKRYGNMYFVIPDSTSVDPVVDGVHWKKIALTTVPGDEDEYKEEMTKLVKANNSRWIYIDFTLDTTDFKGYTYRQIGLFSGLSVVSPATEAQDLYTVDQISTETAILEAIQNRTAVTRQEDQREVIAMVLEF